MNEHTKTVRCGALSTTTPVLCGRPADRLLPTIPGDATMVRDAAIPEERA